MNLIKEYFLRERTILLILSDILVICGVLFLDFDVARMYGFYYIDFSVFLISFAIYNLIINKKLEVSNIFVATIVMLIIIGFFILAAIKVVLPIEIESLQDALIIFDPYYDVPVFAMLVIRADYLNVKTYLGFDNDLAKSEYSKLLLYNIYLIPTLIFAAFFAMAINIDIKISLAFALIVIRNIIEYKGFKSLNMMRQISGT